MYFRENLNDIHFMAKIENVLSNEDLMKKYQQIDLNKLTLKGRLPFKGDMLDRMVSIENPMNQRYWNMADNQTLKRRMVEDIKSWISADDYKNPAKRFLIHGTRYRNRFSTDFSEQTGYPQGSPPSTFSSLGSKTQ